MASAVAHAYNGGLGAKLYRQFGKWYKKSTEMISIFVTISLQLLRNAANFFSRRYL